MPAIPASASQSTPTRSPVWTTVLSWLVPGSGHFLLGRKKRGAIVFATVVLTFLLGVLMGGPMFHPGSNGDVLSRVIEWGGFFGDLASGLLYFVAVWAGYNPPDQAGHNPDYGSKFIVAAGLLNILAMVD